MAQCQPQIQFQECFKFEKPGMQEKDEEGNICSIFRNCRYLQPPKRESCRPIYSYKKPEIPMACDTIYKGSFDLADSRGCRSNAFKPVTNIKHFCGPISDETVTKLSFRPFECVERPVPIYPRSNKLFGSECPLQSLTSQKHDFVYKYRPKLAKIVPSGNLGFLCGPTETMTIQKLSFTPLYGIPRTKSFKPEAKYERSDLPMAQDTTQKMSFTPVPLPAKELYPWAQKPKYLSPSICFARDTVQKLSYQPPGCFLDDVKMACKIGDCWD